MRRGLILFIALLCMTLPQLSDIAFEASAADETYEPGFVEWNVGQGHRIYISGDGNNVNLTRDYEATDEGTVMVRAGQSGSLGPLTMPPLEMGFSGTFNISSFVSAYLGPGTVNQALCRSQWPLEVTTTVTIGDSTYVGTVNDYIDEGSADAINMTTQTEMMNITAREGDIISFSLEANTACPNAIYIHWGGSKQNSGGITIEGNLFTPEASVTVDDARLAHIQFVATLPWGFEDLNQDYTTMNIYGPVEPDEKRVYDEDMRPEGFTPTSTYITRTDEMGREAKVFTGRVPLPTGDNVLIICLKTVDSQFSKENCNHEGIIRFEVEGEDEPIASAQLWLSISGFISVIAYLYFLIRQGILLPLPLIAALVVMAMLMIPLASDIPDIGGEAIVADDARAPSFILHKSENGSVSLDELLDGKEAVIIGISMPASSNAKDQAAQIENAVDRLDGRVSAAQIITGDDARMEDVYFLKESLNVSWPILKDDGENRFANRMPLGASDSIVIIDSSGHITYHAVGTSSSEDLIDAVEEIGYGGQQSIFDTLDLFWGPGLALLLVALPRKKYEAPEEPLMPGSLWASIIVAGGIGFTITNIIPMLVSFIPTDNDFRLWIDLVLLIWFMTAALRSAINGTPIEVKYLASKLHSIYPNNFREWREVQDVERDLLIGFWLGWFIWLAHPALLTQGVVAATLTGGFNWVFGPLMLIMHIITAGILTLIIRFVASWGGPLSRAFGSFGSGPFSEALGWALIPISIWVTIDAILNASSIGLI
ncbi:MAG: hypothetical protein QGI21_00730 [Candidatus Poseidoniaceae archaeon]|nr:hypothetical protein [Candidatus Poseidoniaceae archaeon]